MQASRSVSILAVVGLLASAGTASSQPETPTDAGYFLDGGTALFIYGSLGVALAAELNPLPRRPLLFSASEGGAERRTETIPNYQVGVLAGALTLTLASFDREARWYHVKGMAQSLATTAALTQVAKVSFGRHRPSYDPLTSPDDDRKSFFSGHASLTSSSVVYLGLYLRHHVAKDAWWELPAYGGLAALALYVPYTRVVDHKHHVSDVVTGALVGSTLSAAFFVYQERRFRHAQSGDTSTLTFVPWREANGVSISGAF